MFSSTIYRGKQKSRLWQWRCRCRFIFNLNYCSGGSTRGRQTSSSSSSSLYRSSQAWKSKKSKYICMFVKPREVRRPSRQTSLTSSPRQLHGNRFEVLLVLLSGKVGLEFQVKKHWLTWNLHLGCFWLSVTSCLRWKPFLVWGGFRSRHFDVEFSRVPSLVSGFADHDDSTWTARNLPRWRPLGTRTSRCIWLSTGLGSGRSCHGTFFLPVGNLLSLALMLSKSVSDDKLSFYFILHQSMDTGWSSSEM